MEEWGGSFLCGRVFVDSLSETHLMLRFFVEYLLPCPTVNRGGTRSTLRCASLRGTLALPPITSFFKSSIGTSNFALRLFFFFSTLQLSSSVVL